MTGKMIYQILSDLIIAVHFMWIAFMLLGFWLTAWHFFRVYFFKLSTAKADRFFNRFIFRTLHLLGIGYVATLTLLGKYCPLSILENYLKAGYDPQAVYPGVFIIHYIELLVYPNVHPLVIVIPTIALAVFTVFVYVLRPPQKIRHVLKLKSK
jgi:hypothetical protein